MKKRVALFLLIMVITMMLTGCCLRHEYFDATCVAPKTCSKCGKTEGTTVEHKWVEATCVSPKICNVCNAIEGEVLEHTWKEATCSSAKTCSVCNITEGEALEHTLTEANYQEASKCSVCGKFVGEPLQADFEKYGFECKTECGVPYGFYSEGQYADVTFSDYEIFSGDSKHEELEGYEWKAITIEISFRSGDADYGTRLNDYYNVGDGDINYYGIDYPEVKIDFESIVDEYLVNENGDRCYRSVGRLYVRGPKGYDGFVVVLVDAETKKSEGDFIEVVNENTLYFRLK